MEEMDLSTASSWDGCEIQIGRSQVERGTTGIVIEPCAPFAGVSLQRSEYEVHGYYITAYNTTMGSHHLNRAGIVLLLNIGELEAS